MIATYRVTFSGRLVPGYGAQQVRANLTHSAALDQTALDQWFSGETVILAGGLSFEAAISLREHYAKQGALCELEAEHAATPPPVETVLRPAEDQAVAVEAQAQTTSYEPVFEAARVPLGPALGGLRQPVAAPGLWFVATGGLYLFDWYYRSALELGQRPGRETLKLLIPGYNLVLLYRQLKSIQTLVGGFSAARVFIWLSFWLSLGLILLCRYSRLWPVYFLAGLALMRVQRAVNQDEDCGQPATALGLAALIVLSGIAYGGYRLNEYNREQLEAFSQLAPERYGTLRLAGDETLVLAARLVYLDRAKQLMNDVRLTPASRYQVLDEALRHLEPYARQTGARADYYLMVDQLRQANRFALRNRRARNRLNAAIIKP